jgi:hypothetical protein
VVAETSTPLYPLFEEDYSLPWSVLEELWTPPLHYSAPPCIAILLDIDVGIQCLISLGSDPQGSTFLLQESASHALVP